MFVFVFVFIDMRLNLNAAVCDVGIFVVGVFLVTVSLGVNPLLAPK